MKYFTNGIAWKITCACLIIPMAVVGFGNYFFGWSTRPGSPVDEMFESVLMLMGFMLCLKIAELIVSLVGKDK